MYIAIRHRNAEDQGAQAPLHGMEAFNTLLHRRIYHESVGSLVKGARVSLIVPEQASQRIMDAAENTKKFLLSFFFCFFSYL